MGKVVSLSCTNCGGRVTCKNGSYFCEFCGSECLLENETESFSYEERENYTIIAGKLEKYVGTSTNICIPNNVLVIGREAFANLDTVERIILPPSLVKIEDDAFLTCRKLKRIIIPSSVRHIGKRAFKESGLESVVITGSLEYLGAEAFMQCENLEEVTILQQLPSECRHIFKYCRRLSCANIGKELLAPSFVASVEAKKEGDTRPTYFDLFQGTPFFKEKQALYAQRKCIYCDGQISSKNVCEGCRTKYYKKATRGCYVATCVYGSYDCPQVWTLRRYRDDTLGATWYGRLFIRAYYAISPTLVKWFGNTAWFKKMWKGKLDRMVAKLQSKGVENTPYEDKNW